MRVSRSSLGLIELALAQFMISVGLIIAKTLIPSISLYLMQTVRFGCSALFLFGLMLWLEKNGLRQIKEVLRDPKLRSALFWQALCGGFLFNIFMVMGLKYTSAAIAGVIAAALPAMLAVLSYFFLRERISNLQCWSIALAVAGLVLIAMPSDDGQFATQWLGDLLVMLALIPEAGFTILAKKQKIPLDIIPLSTIICAINAFCFLPLLIWQGSAQLFIMTSTQFLTIMFYGIFAALFFVLWYRGLKDNSGTTAALMTSVMPIGTAILAFLFLEENLTTSQLMGMSLVIVSIILGSGAMKLKRKTIAITDI